MFGDLGDVQQSVGTREELDECAEFRETNDFAEIDFADLRDGGNVADDFECALEAVGVAG